MRGVYGKHRAPRASIMVGAEGLIAEAEGRRLWEESQRKPLLEQAKVAAVITLSAVAVIVGAKVLSLEGKRRTTY